MSQEYTPVEWVDETTSQQGTLINADRLDQMQTAHHYADGFEEVDAIPTEDPGVDYHKVVYCTADSTFYRWDGTQWTADIDEETKALLNQEIARATQAEGELAQDIEDEATARAQADTALGARIDEEAQFREDADRQIATQIGALNGQVIPLNSGSSTPTIQNAIAANEGNISNLTSVVDGLTYDLAQEVTDRAAAIASLQASKADKATTLAGYGITDAYTEAETDTLLASKADVTALTDGSVTKVGTADLGTDTKPIKLVGGVPTAVTNDLVSTTGNLDLTGPLFSISAGANSYNGGRLSADKYSTKADGFDITAATSYAKMHPLPGLTDKNEVPVVRPVTYVTENEARYAVQFLDASKASHIQEIVTYNRDTNTMSSPMVSNALDAYAPMVRTANAQTIGGVKTFTNQPIMALGGSGARLPTTSDYMHFGTIQSSTDTNFTVPVIIFERGGLVIGDIAVTVSDGAVTAVLFSGKTIVGSSTRMFVGATKSSDGVELYCHSDTVNRYFVVNILGAMSGSGYGQRVAPTLEIVSSTPAGYVEAAFTEA